ncbi:hypothetical protein [Coleofasciculus sp. LEGE 07092]|uniref:hypothetical protein n=1 Tax=Coleofasciculus sp. LEGE 07092 TaxID=2777969 RepID=UPI00187EA65E|nr:hypothetical protein [Coleofasciculus sp. LEGE 07092]MBE9151049.1 hypothetical protein [Coleofasciculus sp. LEGE 07092]
MLQTGTKSLKKLNGWLGGNAASLAVLKKPQKLTMSVMQLEKAKTSFPLLDMRNLELQCFLYAIATTA